MINCVTHNNCSNCNKKIKINDSICRCYCYKKFYCNYKCANNDGSFICNIKTRLTLIKNDLLLKNNKEFCCFCINCGEKCKKCNKVLRKISINTNIKNGLCKSCRKCCYMVYNSGEEEPNIIAICNTPNNAKKYLIKHFKKFNKLSNDIDDIINNINKSPIDKIHIDNSPTFIGIKKLSMNSLQYFNLRL
jgi:hypothetical protein